MSSMGCWSEMRSKRKTLLIVVGNEGPETIEINNLIKKLYLNNNVRLISGISEGELFCLYRKCELLIAPSLIEGFGLPVLEALLCGSRVVCSDIPAFREIGGEACGYFDLQAPSILCAMTEAIRNVLLEKPRIVLDSERFSAKAISENYTVLYEQLNG